MPKVIKTIILVTVIVILLMLIFAFLYYLNIIPHKRYTAADFNIEIYTSNIDKDEDGIDDQTDILNGVREYIATKPKYKSKYYDGGYPNDEYGVCTDVVGFGLLSAGYDLKELVNADILNNKNMYDIKTVDKNIDFRRVKNLIVYFKNTATELTTDINKIEEWQGGDIVVFKNHIGIVSDVRNKKGIPFIIHNYEGINYNYEQDILEYYNDIAGQYIVGHFRIS